MLDYPKNTIARITPSKKTVYNDANATVESSKYFLLDIMLLFWGKNSKSS